jgi:hypothetical protein
MEITMASALFRLTILAILLTVLIPSTRPLVGNLLALGLLALGFRVMFSGLFRF